MRERARFEDGWQWQSWDIGCHEEQVLPKRAASTADKIDRMLNNTSTGISRLCLVGVDDGGGGGRDGDCGC